MSDEDTKFSYNSVKPNEVLEVAVYGTQAGQAVCVQYEDFRVTIKEEDLDDYLDIISLEHQNPNYVIRSNFINKPIIYTTRLDHMQAFDKIEKHNAKEIAEMILEESKPRYKPTTEINKVEPMNADISTYVKLNCQVHHMNTKVKIETSRRNDKLLKLCKPLKIVLNDIKTLIKTEPTKIPSDDDVVNSFAEDSSDDEPLLTYSTNSHTNTAVNTVNKVNSTTAVVIKDKRSQEVDLYIVNSITTCIQSYYRTGTDQCANLQELHKSKSRIFLEYCCWVNREKLVKNLKGMHRLSITYMRTRHNCLPRPCSCCCASSDLPSKRGGLNIQFKKNISNKELIAPVPSNIIEKAFNFVQKVDVRQVPIPTDSDCLKNAVIIIKYHEIMFAQSGILGENYEIGIRGDLINYVRPTVNRSITEEKQLYQKHDQPNEPRIYFSSLVCCWHRRESIIAELSESSCILPSTLRFMKTPHPCKVAKCMCCCKPGPLINFVLRREPIVRSNKKQDIALHSKVSSRTHTTHDENRRAIYFKDYNQDLKEHRKTLVKFKATRQHKIFDIPNQPAKVNKSSVSNVPQNPTKNTKDLTAGPCQQGLIPNSKHQTNVNLHSNQDSAQPTTTSTSLTKSFLGNIKDFKVAVNENGKLTAVINALPGQMPTADIKTISDVLLIASEKIKVLGITPQEFCNRVNKSKTMDGLNSILMPELAHIHSNAVNVKLPISAVDTSTSTKTSSTPGFKTPKTRDVNPVCSIYQMMSSIGGKKNLLLIEAYRIHFGEQYEMVIAPKVPPSSSNSCNHLYNSNKDWEPPKITEGSSVTNDKPRVGMPTLAPILKRKINQTANEPKGKKLRQIHVSQLPTIVPAPLKNGITGTKKNLMVQKQVNVKTPVLIFEPHVKTIDGHFPHSSTKSNVISTQSLIDNVVPSLVANNIITPLENKRWTEPQLLEKKIAINSKKPLRGAIPPTDKNTESLFIVDDNFDDDSVPYLKDDVLCLDNVRPQINASVSSIIPAKSGVVNNPMLLNILSKKSSCPTRLAHQSGATRTKQHFEDKTKKRKMNNNLRDEDREAEISMKENGDLSQEQIIETLNNKQLLIINNNDDVEGIFGV